MSDPNSVTWIFLINGCYWDSFRTAFFGLGSLMVRIYAESCYPNEAIDVFREIQAR